MTMTTPSTSISQRISASLGPLRSIAAVTAIILGSASAIAQSPQPPADNGPDPALVNLALTDQTTQQPVSPGPQDYLQQAPAPIVRSAPKPAALPADNLAPDPYNAPATNVSTDAPTADPAADAQVNAQINAGEDALDDANISADQPPPPLPDYDQPPAPADDYLWTPGYWGYSDVGYYWVPGVWIYPPYYGALWTPPYWGFYGGRFRWHPGYWGTHIGFYGGVNYGYGYIGVGYFGGYWNGGHFFYNHSVTNVGVSVTNVYTHTVVYNNHQYGPRPTNNVSYNGGRGGINVAPRPAELAAMNEAHTPALSGQVRLHQSAAQNPQAAFSANRGQVPSSLAARTNPLGANRTIAPSQSAFQTRGNAQVQRSPAQPQAQTQPRSQPRPATQSRPAPASHPAQSHPAPAATSHDAKH